MNKTKILWVDYTWNPVTGCTPISRKEVIEIIKRHKQKKWKAILEGKPWPSILELLKEIQSMPEVDDETKS